MSSGAVSGGAHQGAGRAELEGALEVGARAVDDADIGVAQRLEGGDAHQAHAAGADNEHGGVLRLEVGLLRRGVGGDARAADGRGPLGVDPVERYEVLVVRHEDLLGVAAVALDAQRSLGVGAAVLPAGLVGGTLAAAEPGVDDDLLALLDGRVGAGGLHDTDDLVAHDEGVLGAGDLVAEELPVAEGEPALADVDVGVAHAGVRDAHAHLIAGELLLREFHFGDGLVVDGPQCVALPGANPFLWFLLELS